MAEVMHFEDFKAEGGENGCKVNKNPASHQLIFKLDKSLIVDSKKIHKNLETL
jgi:hypothetical protein